MERPTDPEEDDQGWLRDVGGPRPGYCFDCNGLRATTWVIDATPVRLCLPHIAERVARSQEGRS